MFRWESPRRNIFRSRLLQVIPRADRLSADSIGALLRKSLMKRMKITHKTVYHYHTPVTFGPHRALLRPREGHDLHIASSLLEIEPKADVRWLRDIYGNSITIFTFLEPGRKLSLLSEMDVDLYDDEPIEWLIDPNAVSYPFQYGADEQVEIIQYRLPSYPHDGPAIQRWLLELYRPGQLVNTPELLDKLNNHIFESFRYVRREEAGVQLPCQTLALGTGSCRDFAVFMMEAAPALGFRGAICHRLYPNGRRAARRYPRLDRNLRARQGLAWVRSDEQ